MTYLEKLFADKVEDIKKFIVVSSCPHNFGFPDDGDCSKKLYNEGDCQKCWNREAEESEEVCGR